MAEITVRGYVNKPATKESSNGKFATFSLAERQRQKDGTFKKVYYDAVDFNNPAPAESSFVKVTGWFSVKEYTKNDGTTGYGLSINVQKIEVAPPRDGAANAGSSAEDPFKL